MVCDPSQFVMTSVVIYLDFKKVIREWRTRTMNIGLRPIDRIFLGDQLLYVTQPPVVTLVTYPQDCTGLRGIDADIIISVSEEYYYYEVLGTIPPSVDDTDSEGDDL